MSFIFHLKCNFDANIKGDQQLLIVSVRGYGVGQGKFDVELVHQQNDLLLTQKYFEVHLLLDLCPPRSLADAVICAQQNQMKILRTCPETSRPTFLGTCMPNHRLTPTALSSTALSQSSYTRCSIHWSYLNYCSHSSCGCGPLLEMHVSMAVSHWY